MKNIPSNMIGNMRKNSGNLNAGVSNDDESADSDHECFVYFFIKEFIRIKNQLKNFLKELHRRLNMNFFLLFIFLFYNK